MKDGMTEIFGAVAEYGYRTGVRNVKDMSACWEVQVDEHWRFAMAGKDGLSASDGTPVPRANIYITYNGWPAGIIDINSGEFAASSVANESAFLTALSKIVPPEAKGGAK